MKLAENEFFALKVIKEGFDMYYGGSGALRSAKLYKTLNKAKAAQDEVLKYYGEATKIVILTITERDYTES